MIKFKPYTYTIADIQTKLDLIKSQPIPFDDGEFYLSLLNMIDLTSLEGADNLEKIKNICQLAVSFIPTYKKSVAAVCFYPTFAGPASRFLSGTEIKTAVVAGAFPSGHTPIRIKLDEVKYAINQGAEEIDMVISRGKFLEGNFQQVYDEVAAIKELCDEVTLKVILETGELKSVENIRKASEIAINAGADFIKTSTGKFQPAATPEAVVIMAETVKEFFQLTGRKVGIKAAGGIATPEDAAIYSKIILNILGVNWFNNMTFRIGASRLVQNLTGLLNENN